MALTRNMTATWVTTGLVGTLAYTVYAQDGTVLVARATAGVTELPVGSGTYRAMIDPTWSGSIEWDDGTNFSGEDFVAVPAAAADAAAIKVVTDELAAMLQDGTGAKQFTQQALAQAPTGSGGSSPITITDKTISITNQ